MSGKSSVTIDMMRTGIRIAAANPDKSLKWVAHKVRELNSIPDGGKPTAGAIAERIRYWRKKHPDTWKLMTM